MNPNEADKLSKEAEMKLLPCSMSNISDSVINSRKCKHGESGCGIYFDCWKCDREYKAAAYRRLTEKEKAYDRRVDPFGYYHEDFPSCCSCHICAPCSYCVRDDESQPNEKNTNE